MYCAAFRSAFGENSRNPGLQSQLCELTLDTRQLQTFALLDGKKLPSGFALGETPQEQILRPAALHNTEQCESRKTSLHTNIPISRDPLNYAGERESPISLATQQQQLMACVWNLDRYRETVKHLEVLSFCTHGTARLRRTASKPRASFPTTPSRHVFRSHLSTPSNLLFNRPGMMTAPAKLEAEVASST